MLKLSACRFTCSACGWEPPGAPPDGYELCEPCGAPIRVRIGVDDNDAGGRWGSPAETAEILRKIMFNELRGELGWDGIALEGVDEAAAIGRRLVDHLDAELRRSLADPPSSDFRWGGLAVLIELYQAVVLATAPGDVVPTDLEAAERLLHERGDP